MRLPTDFQTEIQLTCYIAKLDSRGSFPELGERSQAAARRTGQLLVTCTTNLSGSRLGELNYFAWKDRLTSLCRATTCIQNQAATQNLEIAKLKRRPTRSRRSTR